jgi:hypothetical protein
LIRREIDYNKGERIKKRQIFFKDGKTLGGNEEETYL